MSDVCREFKGWFRSFTKTEIFLCTLQAVFLIVFVSFLTYIILHLLACLKSKQFQNIVSETTVITTNKIIFTEDNYVTDELLESEQSSSYTSSFTVSDKTNNTTEPMVATDRGGNMTKNIHKEEKKVTKESNEEDISGYPIYKPEITCTWIPSQKTKIFTHYYETDKKLSLKKFKDVKNMSFNQNLHLHHSSENTFKKYIEDVYEEEKGNNHQRAFLLALVKKKPSHDFTFGCTLTIISQYWTVTAASCIEAIEEVDFLDSFAITDDFSDQNGNLHEVSDVKIHPKYLGLNTTYDLAVLKSADRVAGEGFTIATLPTMLDYYLIALGERLSILGYGTFRKIDENPLQRSVRVVHVFNLPLSQCPGGSGAWSTRHLSGGTPVEHATCGIAPLCAGVLHFRSSPCNFCAGTPILSQNLLLGVMSDNQRCGLSCAPTLYVNVAMVRDWIDNVILSSSSI